jgi:hypothetical protein
MEGIMLERTSLEPLHDMFHDEFHDPLEDGNRIGYGHSGGVFVGIGGVIGRSGTYHPGHSFESDGGSMIGGVTGGGGVVPVFVDPVLVDHVLVDHVFVLPVFVDPVFVVPVFVVHVLARIVTEMSVSLQFPSIKRSQIRYMRR